MHPNQTASFKFNRTSASLRWRAAFYFFLN
jgi:hypothetical protein